MVADILDKTERAGVYFQEEQRFNHLWLRLLVGVIAGFAWLSTIVQLTLGKDPWGKGLGTTLLQLTIWLLVGVGMPLLFFSACLVVEVRDDGLYIRYIPFHRSYKRIAWTEIERVEVRTYRPILEYGRWGIQGWVRNRAYNVYGNRGLQLYLFGGRRLLISSQRVEELAEATRRAMEKAEKSGKGL